MQTYEIMKGGKVLETMEKPWVDVQERVKVLNAEHRGGVVARKAIPRTAIENNVLYVDCWTSGNPGKGGYKVMLGISDVAVEVEGRGEDNPSSETHTNNFFELYAVYAGLRYAVKHGNIFKIYSDSRIAIQWATTGRYDCREEDKVSVGKLITKIQSLMVTNPDVKLVKWDTTTRGEIPADFGRK